MLASIRIAIVHDSKVETADAVGGRSEVSTSAFVVLLDDTWTCENQHFVVASFLMMRMLLVLLLLLPLLLLLLCISDRRTKRDDTCQLQTTTVKAVTALR